MQSLQKESEVDELISEELPEQNLTLLSKATALCSLPGVRNNPTEGQTFGSGLTGGRGRGS